MNQSCRPHIHKPSRAQILAEFDRAMDWLESMAAPGPASRFQMYRAKLSHAFRLLLENRPDQILKQIPPAEFIEINFEANALIEVWRQFGTENSQILATKLSRNAMKNRPDPNACLGFVGLNVSKIVHLDASGVPRYLPTRYGDYLLSPDVVAVKHESQFGAAVHQRESFIDQHVKTLRRPVPEHVAGFILFYRVSGMDMSGTGRMFVTTYPKIGALSAASASEDKLLRSLHSELLKNFL